MIKNHFKMAWRNLSKNKGYSSINIFGLAVGMAVTMLIALWIWDEVTFDHYHSHHKQLARVITTTFFEGNDGVATSPAVPMPIADELRTKYASDFKNVSMASWNYDHTLSVGDKKITADGMWTESGFPSMFSLRMKEGNSKALEDPSSVLLSASIAKALFGNASPINSVVKFDNKYDFKVAGVFEDLAQNTTLFETKFLLPWTKYITTEGWLKDAQTQWRTHSFQAFVEVNENSNIDKLSEKTKDLVMAKRNAGEGKEELLLHPMDKWHLYSQFENGVVVGGRIKFVRLFSIIGIFTLLLACINFMNLSTARSEKRTREVGIRKAVGSLRTHLIAQFLSESVLIAAISFAFSLLLVVLLVPLFNTLAEKQINLPWNNGKVWIIGLLFTVVTGLMAGNYPAFYLSGFGPMKVLKGTVRAGKFASIPRKVLVVVQFTFSIALIAGTIIVFKQIQYAKNRPVNYKSEGLITVRMSTPELYGHYDAVRGELLQTGVVRDMAESNSSTTNVNSNNSGFSWQGKDPNALMSFGTISVTTDFGNTIGWKIKEGRDFSKDFSTDSLAIILNEAAVAQIGMEGNIVGQTILYGQKNYSVVGVIKDMIMESPYEPIKPTVFFNDLNNCNTITISIKPGTPVQDALSRIGTVFKKYNAPFHYSFNDEEYARKFSDEQRIGKLATFFSVLATLICCLGLFGLAAFVAEQRRKEIGVRKVLGASVFSMWQMLVKEFALLIVIACIISIPLAWYSLHQWLQNYEYKTNITWWIFLFSCGGAILVTLITVSFHTIKAALSNPVKSLRTE